MFSYKDDEDEFTTNFEKPVEFSEEEKDSEQETDFDKYEDELWLKAYLGLWLQTISWALRNLFVFPKLKSFDSKYQKTFCNKKKVNWKTIWKKVEKFNKRMIS